MPDIVQLWHAEHGKFKRLLDHLAERTARIADGEDQHLGVVADIVSYLHHYGERAHHPREDIGFARLARIDPDFAPVVSDLRREHEAIGEAGAQLVGQLERLASGNAVVTREALATRTRHYLDLHRAHLDREEREIIPRIAGRFDAGDWQAVRAEIQEKVDARLPPDLLPRFQRLSHEISVELAIV